MRLREFAPSPDRDNEANEPDYLLQLANRWWNAADPSKQDRIAATLKSLGYAISQVESEDDAVQITHLPTGHVFFISADEFDPELDEAVNPAIMQPGWERREHRGGLDLLASYNEPRGQRVLSILAYDRGGREIGNAHFEVVDDHLESFDTYVRPDMRHQGIATVMYDYAQELGNDLKPSGYQTSAGKKFWRARKQQPQQVAEISDELRRSYLDRAGRHVDRRMDRMARVRDRLNKGYEIYHADRPAGATQIVDRFEADTLEQARRYYEQYIQNYESDRDFDLRLRRATGIMEIARIPQGDYGDEGTISGDVPKVKKKPLPGGSGLTYGVNRKDPEFMEIMIFDGDKIAGELDLGATLDPLKTWRVESVVAAPEYKGQGIGKALYLSLIHISEPTRPY